MVTHDALGWDPGGWTVCDLVTLVATWLTTLHFGLYWARWGFEEAQPYQLAGDIKPSFRILQNFFVRFWIRKQWLSGQSCWRKTNVSLSITRWVVIFGMKTYRFGWSFSAMWVYWLCSSDLLSWMGFLLDISLYRPL